MSKLDEQLTNPNFRTIFAQEALVNEVGEALAQYLEKMNVDYNGLEYHHRKTMDRLLSGSYMGPDLREIASACHSVGARVRIIIEPAIE